MQMTPNQALKVTKEMSKRREESQLSIADFNGNFSFASDRDVKVVTTKIRSQFDKTIKELATR